MGIDPAVLTAELQKDPAGCGYLSAAVPDNYELAWSVYNQLTAPLPIPAATAPQTVLTRTQVTSALGPSLRSLTGAQYTRLIFLVGGETFDTADAGLMAELTDIFSADAGAITRVQAAAAALPPKTLPSASTSRAATLGLASCTLADVQTALGALGFAMPAAKATLG